MNVKPPELSVVLPCYNEQEVLPETAKRLAAKLEALKASGKIGPGSRAFFVDDGSQDATWASIKLLASANSLFEGLKLSRNCGHQNALMAGLLTVPGDIILSMDADLQDDLDAIDAMVDAHAGGADIVYGVRERRDLDTTLKRNSARAYYHLLAWFGVKIVFDHADFRLMSRRAIEALREHREVHLFLRALVPLLGFKTATVKYDRGERFAGTSKYPLRRMARLAIDGITSFSVRPLRIITLTGFAISAMSFLLGAWALIAALGFGVTVPGWTSTVVPIYLICGIQMLSLGVIGEYVGKIYMETKQRPRFVLDELTWAGASPIPGEIAPALGTARNGA